MITPITGHAKDFPEGIIVKNEMDLFYGFYDTMLTGMRYNILERRQYLNPIARDIYHSFEYIVK